MDSWTVPAAFWLAQALQSDPRSRLYKWEQARSQASWLPSHPPTGADAMHLLVDALAFLAEAGSLPRNPTVLP